MPSWCLQGPCRCGARAWSTLGKDITGIIDMNMWKLRRLSFYEYNKVQNNASVWVDEWTNPHTTYFKRFFLKSVLRDRGKLSVAAHERTTICSGNDCCFFLTCVFVVNEVSMDTCAVTRITRIGLCKLHIKSLSVSSKQSDTHSKVKRTFWVWKLSACVVHGAANVS